jgi:hypothetical protein
VAVPPPGAAACTRAHSAAVRDRRSARRPGLPGRSAGKRGRHRRTPTRRPGPATALPLTNAMSAASPASRPPRPSLEPSPARQPQGLPPAPVVTVARPPRPGPQRHCLSMGGDGRVRTDRGRHQTAGQRTAGRWTGGQQTADRRTRWTTAPGHRTPDGRTAGSRTPKAGWWTPPAGQRRPTPWLGCWPGRPRPRRPTARDRLDAAPGKPSSGRATTRTAQRQGRRGHPRC